MNIRAALLVPLAIPLLTLVVAASRPDDKKVPMAGGDFTIDAVHSTVIFRIQHAKAGYSFGRFDDIKGTFSIDPAKPEASKIDVTIQSTSIDTNQSHRDDDLRGPNFFDVKQFPTATFKSKSVAKKGDHGLAVTGDLMIHGVTKTVTIDMEHVGSNEVKGKRTGYFGVLDIKRSDYGMTYMPDMLGDDVQLTLSFEGTTEKAK